MAQELGQVVGLGEGAAECQAAGAGPDAAQAGGGAIGGSGLGRLQHGVEARMVELQLVAHGVDVVGLAGEPQVQDQGFEAGGREGASLLGREHEAEGGEAGPARLGQHGQFLVHGAAPALRAWRRDPSRNPTAGQLAMPVTPRRAYSANSSGSG